MIDSLRAILGHRFPPMGPTIFNLFRRFGPKRIDSELLPGIRASLNLRDMTQFTTWWQGERFEKPTCQVVRSWVGEGATVFFDIGSNYGFFSYLVSSVRPDLPIHAFEPHPRTFAVLKEIQTRNRLRHLSCWNMGLGDRPEQLSLHPGDDDSGHSTFGDHPVLKGDASLSVEIDTFSHWRERAGLALPSFPSWVAKIDVEGFELKVLRGMRQELLAKCFRGLVVEINPDTLSFCGVSAGDVYDFFNEVGYEPLSIGRTDRNSPLSENAFFVPRDSR